jgi:hypothetical protein
MALEIPLDYANGDESALGDVSDGYHSFNELYAHRHALFLALCRATGMGWKSRLHPDGSGIPGWFLAGLTLPVGGDISYHLPDNAWDTADFLVTVPRAPSWDGHTSEDVVERLSLYVMTPEDTP